MFGRFGSYFPRDFLSLSLALALALPLIYFHSLYAFSSTFPFIFCVFSCSSILVSMPLSIWLPRVCYSQFPCLWFFYRKTIISLQLLSFARSLARLLAVLLNVHCLIYKDCSPTFFSFCHRQNDFFFSLLAIHCLAIGEYMYVCVSTGESWRGMRMSVCVYHR